MRVSSSVIADGLIGGAIGAIVVGLVGVAAWPAMRGDGRPVDRGAVEALLREPSPKTTGKTRSFELAIEETKWELLTGVATTAVTSDRTVPGPLLRVEEGDDVRITVTNRLAEATSVHWHGLHVPNAQDGVAGITQDAIAPGATISTPSPRRTPARSCITRTDRTASSRSIAASLARSSSTRRAAFR